jgi:hypothetical protein
VTGITPDADKGKVEARIAGTAFADGAVVRLVEG